MRRCSSLLRALDTPTTARSPPIVRLFSARHRSALHVAALVALPRMPQRSEGPSRSLATAAAHAADPSTSAEGFVSAGDGQDWLVYGRSIERSANDDRDYRWVLLRRP